MQLSQIGGDVVTTWDTFYVSNDKNFKVWNDHVKITYISIILTPNFKDDLRRSKLSNYYRILMLIRYISVNNGISSKYSY